jgi:hypothetical protein
MSNNHQFEEESYSELIQKLDADSLLFKQILKRIFFEYLKSIFGDSFKESSLVKEFFPRKYRFEIVKKLESQFNIKFPLLRLSRWRLITFSLTLILPPSVLFTYWYTNYDNNFFPDGYIVITLCILIIPVTSFLISLFFPLTFAFYDWHNIKTVNDLLVELTIDNYFEYSKNNYERLITYLNEHSEFFQTINQQLR